VVVAQVSAVQLEMTVQLVQARSCLVVQAVLSCSPPAQVAQVAQVLPFQKCPAAQLVQTASPAVVQVVSMQLLILAHAEQTRLWAVVQAALSWAPAPQVPVQGTQALPSRK
jgi:hypothetical protein